MLKKITRNLALFCSFSILIISCGGGSGGSGETGKAGSSSNKTNSPAKILTARFVDNVVSGLKYKSGNVEGITGSNGEFKYEEGKEVIFTLGVTKFKIEKVTNSIVTPYDVNFNQSTEEENEAAALRLAQVLQTIDSDGNPENGISITDEVEQELDRMIEFSTNDETRLIELLQPVMALPNTKSRLTSKSEALNHISRTFNQKRHRPSKRISKKLIKSQRRHDNNLAFALEKLNQASNSDTSTDEIKKLLAKQEFLNQLEINTSSYRLFSNEQKNRIAESIVTAAPYSENKRGADRLKNLFNSLVGSILFNQISTPGSDIQNIAELNLLYFGVSAKKWQALTNAEKSELEAELYAKIQSNQINNFSKLADYLPKAVSKKKLESKKSALIGKIKNSNSNNLVSNLFALAKFSKALDKETIYPSLSHYYFYRLNSIKDATNDASIQQAIVKINRVAGVQDRVSQINISRQNPATGISLSLSLAMPELNRAERGREIRIFLVPAAQVNKFDRKTAIQNNFYSDARFYSGRYIDTINITTNRDINGDVSVMDKDYQVFVLNYNINRPELSSLSVPSKKLMISSAYKYIRVNAGINHKKQDGKSYPIIEKVESSNNKITVVNAATPAELIQALSFDDQLELNIFDKNNQNITLRNKAIEPGSKLVITAPDKTTREFSFIVRATPASKIKVEQIDSINLKIKFSYSKNFPAEGVTDHLLIVPAADNPDYEDIRNAVRNNRSIKLTSNSLIFGSEAVDIEGNRITAGNSYKFFIYSYYESLYRVPDILSITTFKSQDIFNLERKTGASLALSQLDTVGSIYIPANKANSVVLEFNKDVSIGANITKQFGLYKVKPGVGFGTITKTKFVAPIAPINVTVGTHPNLAVLEFAENFSPGQFYALSYTNTGIKANQLYTPTETLNSFKHFYVKNKLAYPTPTGSLKIDQTNSKFSDDLLTLEFNRQNIQAGDSILRIISLHKASIANNQLKSIIRYRPTGQYTYSNKLRLTFSKEADFEDQIFFTYNYERLTKRLDRISFRHGSHLPGIKKLLIENNTRNRPRIIKSEADLETQAIYLTFDREIKISERVKRRFSLIKNKKRYSSYPNSAKFKIELLPDNKKLKLSHNDLSFWYSDKIYLSYGANYNSLDECYSPYMCAAGIIKDNNNIELRNYSKLETNIINFNSRSNSIRRAQVVEAIAKLSDKSITLVFDRDISLSGEQIQRRIGIFKNKEEAIEGDNIQVEFKVDNRSVKITCPRFNFTADDQIGIGYNANYNNIDEGYNIFMHGVGIIVDADNNEISDFRPLVVKVK